MIVRYQTALHPDIVNCQRVLPLLGQYLIVLVGRVPLTKTILNRFCSAECYIPIYLIVPSTKLSFCCVRYSSHKNLKFSQLFVRQSATSRNCHPELDSGSFYIIHRNCRFIVPTPRGRGIFHQKLCFCVKSGAGYHDFKYTLQTPPRNHRFRSSLKGRTLFVFFYKNRDDRI